MKKKFLGSPNVTKNRTAKGKHYVDASLKFLLRMEGKKWRGKNGRQTDLSNIFIFSLCFIFFDENVPAAYKFI